MEQWNKRGFAAIAMDVINSEKIGIMGVSYGGITATTVVGTDDRFTFGVSVYGCGYLDEGSSNFGKTHIKEDNIHWDAANFSVKAKMPVLFISGNNDVHFTTLSLSNTAAVTPNSYLSLYPNFAHSQDHAEGLAQVYSFAESVVGGKAPFVKISDTRFEDPALTVEFEAPANVAVVKATAYYITESAFPYITQENQVGWKTAEGSVSGNTATITMPTEATHAYVSLTDADGNVISSKFQKIR